MWLGCRKQRLIVGDSSGWRPQMWFQSEIFVAKLASVSPATKDSSYSIRPRAKIPNLSVKLQIDKNRTWLTSEATLTLQRVLVSK